MLQVTTQPPLALYVHFPWCVRKCPYCDFNSHEAREAVPERDYVDALIGDLEQDLPRVWGRSVTAVFMGGGTPSLFSPESIERLMAALRARLALRPDIEVTLEANPGTVEQAKFAEFRAAGINRLSIGAQSFNDDSLARLGRIHGRREALRAAESAHDAGLANFNLDLMFALPEQDLHSALEDLRTAMDLEPAHISHYQLTIEPNTLFHARPPSLPHDDLAWEIQTQCQQLLQERGYTYYEVSAFARGDRQCRHNLNYWRFGDYLGIGAGAHSKLTDVNRNSVSRTWKVKNPRDYLQAARGGNFTAGERSLQRDDLALEFMMNALRLTEGFETALFAERCGIPIATVQAQLEQAEQRGWIQWDTQHLAPTADGLRFLNALLELFVPEIPT
ncbi:MAG: oxygen-independent coproporphyrinogen III oxidase-like protein [Pseudomonadota bacterium]|nr:MAG: oxygen-independent coproporphyrinogen III oxidase-like protein [Pseudomonadota bacterium]